MSVEKILDDFGDKLVGDLRASLKKKGVTSGGGDSRLSGKIKFVITYKDGGYLFNLVMPEYGEFLDGGRGKTKQGEIPGKVKPAIYDWIRRKGIDPRKKLNTGKGVSYNQARDQLAFLIARKIHRKGYKGNHFYADVIKDGRIPKLEDLLAAELNKQVEIIITEGF